MKLPLKANNSLLISGPSSVKLLKGEGEVLGAPLAVAEKIVVKEDKQLPLSALKDAEVEVLLGEGGSINEVEGDAIPRSWRETVERIVRDKESRVMVMGGVDAGKNSFCTLLANRLLEAEEEVAIIDTDVGQSEIGPPTTIGLGLLNEPAPCLSETPAALLFFVGHITPSYIKDKVVRGLKKILKDRACRKRPAIINTDGWLSGDEAKSYKLSLIKEASPTLIVGLGGEPALKKILDEAEAPFAILESPSTIHRRSREERRRLRESGYRRYLKGGKIVALPKSYIELRSFNGSSVGLKRNHVNTLLGLLDENGWLIGLGTLKGVDPKSGFMKIFTPTEKGKVRIVELGAVKVNEQGKELGALALK